MCGCVSFRTGSAGGGCGCDCCWSDCWLRRRSLALRAGLLGGIGGGGEARIRLIRCGSSGGVFCDWQMHGITSANVILDLSFLLDCCGCGCCCCGGGGGGGGAEEDATLVAGSGNLDVALRRWNTVSSGRLRKRFTAVTLTNGSGLSFRIDSPRFSTGRVAFQTSLFRRA